MRPWFVRRNRSDDLPIRNRTRRWALVAPLALAGCKLGDKVCAGLPLQRVTPTNTTIAVGQKVTLKYQSGGYCAGETPTEADYGPVISTAWRTSDTSVVFLDSLTGAVTGRAPGDAQVVAVLNPTAIAVIHVR